MANASNFNSKHSQTFLFPAPAVAVEQLIHMEGSNIRVHCYSGQVLEKPNNFYFSGRKRKLNISGS